jgi:hypothetical protein
MDATPMVGQEYFYYKKALEFGPEQIMVRTIKIVNVNPQAKMLTIRYWRRPGALGPDEEEEWSFKFFDELLHSTERTRMLKLAI